MSSISGLECNELFNFEVSRHWSVVCIGEMSETIQQRIYDLVITKDYQTFYRFYYYTPYDTPNTEMVSTYDPDDEVHLTEVEYTTAWERWEPK